MIDKIKNWYFYKDFKVKTDSIKLVSDKTNPAKNICILFDGSNEEDRKTIHRIKKSLNPGERRMIKSLAFLNNKLPLDNVDYSAYNLRNVKWYGVPFGEKVEEFINFNYDILIVLCKQMLPHFEYIIAHSKCRFIIGPGIDKAERYFDFIVDVEQDTDIQSMMDKFIINLDKLVVKK